MIEEPPDIEHEFAGVLRREGPLYLVDVPVRVTRALGAGSGRVPVVVTPPGGTPVQSTLVPRGGGAHKLFLNAETRGEAGAKVGARVSLSVRVDRDSREVDPPADLVAALREADLLETFMGFGSGKQRHIVDWIDEVKSDDARERRISKVVENLAALAERRSDAR